MTGGRGSGYELFRDHTFRELWSANLALNLGLAMLMLGVAWEMTSLTDNPVLVAMVQTVMSLPFVFFGHRRWVWPAMRGGIAACCWVRSSGCWR